MLRRFHTASMPEIRCEQRADGGATISGYASVFYNASDPGTEYELYSGRSYRVCERIMPGCFDRAIREDDVRALFNHNPDAVLGRMKAGTLRLSVDAKGLRYEIDAPDTQCARDLVACLKRGDISGSSFSFDYQDKSVRMTSMDGMDMDIIEVRAVKLYDVGPVTFPAYQSATSEARSLPDELRRELDERRASNRGAARAKILRAVLAELGI